MTRSECIKANHIPLDEGYALTIDWLSGVPVAQCQNHCIKTCRINSSLFCLNLPSEPECVNKPKNLDIENKFPQSPAFYSVHAYVCKDSKGDVVVRGGFKRVFHSKQNMVSFKQKPKLFARHYGLFDLWRENINQQEKATIRYEYDYYPLEALTRFGVGEGERLTITHIIPIFSS